MQKFVLMMFIHKFVLLASIMTTLICDERLIEFAGEAQSPGPMGSKCTCSVHGQKVIETNRFQNYVNNCKLIKKNLVMIDNVKLSYEYYLPLMK